MAAWGVIAATDVPPQNLSDVSRLADHDRISLAHIALHSIWSARNKLIFEISSFDINHTCKCMKQTFLDLLM